MPSNIKIKTIELVQAFIGENSMEPNYIALTRTEEREFYKLTSEDIGGLAQKIFADGVRKALPVILGLEVRWDAKTFEVGFAGSAFNPPKKSVVTYAEAVAKSRIKSEKPGPKSPSSKKTKR